MRSVSICRELGGGSRSTGPGLGAHSGDLERPIRSIMNTESGDHEHLLALGPERAPTRAERHGGSLPLTVVRLIFPWCSSSLAVGLGRKTGGLAFTKTRSLQLDAMSAMHDAVQNGVADRWVAHEFVPAGYGNLTGHQKRALLVAVIDDLQQIAPLLGGERLGTPVIDDQQLCTFQRRQ